jgi:Domain of unknown function (DUF5655)
VPRGAAAPRAMAGAKVPVMTIPTWVCPDCGRGFGRRGQGHVCEPALGVEAFLATQKPALVPIYRAALDALAEIDGALVEPVNVGILVKHGRTFAELRPRARHVALSFMLPWPLDDPRAHAGARSGRWFAHRVDLRSAQDVDDDVRGWLAEAFVECGPA